MFETAVIADVWMVENDGGEAVDRSVCCDTNDKVGVPVVHLCDLEARTFPASSPEALTSATGLLVPDFGSSLAS